jgi:hypothetical protein
MIGDGEGEAGDDDVGEGFAGDIDALPEAVGAEEDAIDVFLEALEHDGAGNAFSLDVTFEAELVEEGFHALGEFVHEARIGEEDECFAVSLADEMGDPMF